MFSRFLDGDDQSSSSGGGRGDRDPRLWASLIGRDPRQRREAVRTIQALEQGRAYAADLAKSLPRLRSGQRADAGEALSMLGDSRFSRPYFLSEMIYVPAGLAMLGSPDYPSEYPIHTVGVGGFALAQTTVTQAAYEVFIRATGRETPRDWRRGGPDPAHRNWPVINVSARDAEVYCAWLSTQTGHHYRLPTEAEWILAARGGGDQRVYPWGDTFDPSRANAWVDGGIGHPCAVGLFPEGRGIYGHDDLAGNVWEWCSSLFWSYPYQADDGRENPAAEEEQRVMHGGSWRSRSTSLRCAARQGELPTDSFDVVGFRLARDN